MLLATYTCMYFRIIYNYQLNNSNVNFCNLTLEPDQKDIIIYTVYTWKGIPAGPKLSMRRYACISSGNSAIRGVFNEESKQHVYN